MIDGLMTARYNETTGTGEEAGECVIYKKSLTWGEIFDTFMVSKEGCSQKISVSWTEKLSGRLSAFYSTGRKIYGEESCRYAGLS